MKSVNAANSAVVPTSRKFVALYHRNTKIRMRSDELDYSGSSPNRRSRKRTAIIMATFTKPSLSQTHTNSVKTNPVDTNNEGAIESVRIHRVSALGGLNLEKM